MDAVSKELNKLSGPRRAEDLAALLKATNVDQSTLNNAVKISAEQPKPEPTGGLKREGAEQTQQAPQQSPFTNVPTFNNIANVLKTEIARKTAVADRVNHFLYLLKKLGCNQTDFDFIKQQNSKQFPSAQPAQPAQPPVKK